MRFEQPSITLNYIGKGQDFAFKRTVVCLIEHLLKIKDFNLEPGFEPEEWFQNQKCISFCLFFLFMMMSHEFVFVDAATGGDIYSAKHGTIQNILVYENSNFTKLKMIW